MALPESSYIEYASLPSIELTIKWLNISDIAYVPKKTPYVKMRYGKVGL